MDIAEALERLNYNDAKTRYDAILFLARYPKTDEWETICDRVFELTKDAHPQVSRAAGIAASMINARNSEYLRGVPDFLREWDANPQTEYSGQLQVAEQVQGQLPKAFQEFIRRAISAIRSPK